MEESSLMSRTIKAVAFDLDGTIYMGNTIVDSAADIVRFIRGKGMQVFFFTNSSTRTRQKVFEKLDGMGLNPSLDHIYTSAYAVAKYLSGNSISTVFCLGTAGLKDEIAANRIRVTSDPYAAEALVVGLDPDFSYARLADVMPFTERNCPIIVCNRDRSFPVENGKFMPGCGPIVSAVESALGRSVDFIAGKPNTYMMELLEADWGLCNSEIVVVGDSLESDIGMARRHGCRSFLISGNSLETVEGMTVVPDISMIRPYINGICTPE